MVKLSSLTKDYYKPGDVAALLGVTSRAIINYDNTGKMTFERTATGRRLISREALLENLRESQLLIDDCPTIQHDVIYARVSTQSQARSGDLDRQVDMIKTYVADKNPVSLLVLTDVDNGINDQRTQLLRLIDMIFDGQINRIFIAGKDRLTLFGFTYLEKIADANNVRIFVVSNKDSLFTNRDELAQDLLSVVQTFNKTLNESIVSSV